MSIIVDSKQLKFVLSRVNSLLRASMLNNSIQFTIKEKYLYVRVEVNMIYEERIPILSSTENYITKQSASFKPIYELFDTTVPTTITLTSNSICFENLGLNTVLTGAEYTTFLGTTPREAERQPIATTQLVSAIKTLSHLSSLENKLKRVYPIDFSGDVALMYLPTLWVKVNSSALNLQLPIAFSKVIASFLPTEMSVTSDMVQLFNSNGYMLFPAKITIEDTSDFDAIIHSAERLTEVNLYPILSRLSAIAKNDKTSLCQISITDNGFVCDLNGDNQSLSIYIGNIDKTLFTGVIPIVQLIACLSILGDAKTIISKKGEYLCLQTPNVQMISSS